MRGRPKFAWLDGMVVPYDEARVPIDDRGLLFGESLYEVLPITAGRPRLLAEHVARMRAGARELELDAGVPELDRWQALIADLLARDPVAEALLYAQVTGGAAPREHLPEVPPRPTFFAHVTPFRFPRDADARRGIKAVFLPDIRWARRDLKTTLLLPSVLAKKEARRQGANEALFVGPSGHVHEGASSNVFLVEGSAVLTPPQSTSLLPGTMRPLVCEAAMEAGFDVRHEPLPRARFGAASEVFVSSSTQLAMPVVAIDGRAVGDGRAGSVTRELAGRLRRKLELED